jgi:putative FmdB family regulatory protein
MPTYDYQCLQCKQQFEARHPIKADNPGCLACGGATEKVILSAPATHGKMAHGRELAMRSLLPKSRQGKHLHDPGCSCSQR